MCCYANNHVLQNNYCTFCISKLYIRYFVCVFSTVAEVLAQLEDEGSNDSSEVINIFLQPPCDDGISDQDSDKSDGEVEFNINHLGRKLLSTGCEVRRSSRIQQQRQTFVNSNDGEGREATAEAIPESPSPAACDETVPVKRRKTVEAPENLT